MNYIYFIKAGSRKQSPIKIGLSRNVERRIETLQVGNHAELILIMAIPLESRKHAEMVEKRFHRFFRKQKIRGEWFKGNININKCLKFYENIEIEDDEKPDSIIHMEEHFMSI